MSEVKHDYKAALNIFKQGNSQENGTTQYSNEIAQIIIHALKLAAVVTGEPTEGMKLAYVQKKENPSAKFLKEHFRECFKAMIAQAEKEIG